MFRCLKYVRKQWGNVKTKLFGNYYVDGVDLPCGERVNYFSNKGKTRFVALKKDISHVRGRIEIEYKTTKEPETVQWIDALPDGAVLWDIGANVGTYSLYAAIEKKIQVLAFEPSFSNYEALNYNIRLNKVDRIVQAYCIAFNNKKSIAGLKMKNISVGGSGSSFGRSRDHRGHDFVPIFVQGAVGISIDEFIDEFSAPVPDAIKIDVDGNESLILDGAHKTLENKKVKYLSIELNDALENEVRQIHLLLERHGFFFVEKYPTCKHRIDEKGYSYSDDRNHNFHFKKY